MKLIVKPRRTISHLALAGLAASAAPFAALETVSADYHHGGIVINEVMINPREVYDSRGEWIELYNSTSQPIDLGGWTIGDEVYDQFTLPPLVVAPGDYAVLGRDSDPFVNGGAELDVNYVNAIVLYDSTDRLILRDPFGEEIDRVEWGPQLPAPNGSSLSLRSPDADNSVPANFCHAVTVMARGDLGTPGAPNRCESSSANLVITEILQNPAAVGDASGEWFEVFNAGSAEVDLKGFTVKDDDYDSFVVESSIIVPVNGYTVLAAQATGNGDVPSSYSYNGQMVLQNDSDELVIADADLVQLDRVRWDNGATFPDPDGASMALKSPTLDNSIGSNWCTSTRPWANGDKGSPGTATWCLTDGDQPVVITEVMFDPESSSTERHGEWFELSNLGPDAVDLDGWTLTAGDFKQHTISNFVLAANSIAVFAASGDQTLNGGVAAAYVFGLDLPLYNKTGRVIVRSADGVVVDRVDWNATAGYPGVPGHSMSLLSPVADNSLGANWCSSPVSFGDGDFGSPGLPNTCEQPVAVPEVIISEVLRNPAAVSDGAGEWFEIFNFGESDVDLMGWVLSDGASDRHQIKKSVVVRAGEYLVLGRSTDQSINGGAEVDYAYGASFVLSNSFDTIALHDKYGQLVTRTSWTVTDELRPNGASVALVDGVWCESGPQFGRGDRGTPGASNDCTPLPHPNVVINEVHIDPAALSDTVAEWFELFNAGDSPVDINGWVLRDDDFDAHRIDVGGPLIIAAGDTLVLGRDVAAMNGGAEVDYVYGSSLPLVESSDEINVYTATLVPVDRVAWTPSRQLPYAVGASASLRSPLLDNLVPNNWCTSVTEFGTKGEKGTPNAANVCEIEVPPTSTTSTSTTTTVPPTSTTAPATSTPSTSTTSTTSTTIAPTTTTPVPPVVSMPNVIALSSAGVSSGVSISGSQINITGDLRGNSHVLLSGSSINVSGTISYGGVLNISRKATHGGLVNSPSAITSPLPWTVADFAPGGTYAHGSAYVSHGSTIVIGSSGLAAGIHYVKGDVFVSGNAPNLVGITIVATGTITISGGSTLSPYAAGYPTLLAGGGSTFTTAIQLSGSSVTWSGIIAAPNGGVQVNGAHITGGTVVGSSVQISGSKINIG